MVLVMFRWILRKTGKVRIMNVLAIGNSFSQDAMRYLHGIARSQKVDLTAVNLYIGGCPLSRHYRNMLSGEKAYSLEFNGESTGFFISMKEALLSRDWDVVTLQQVSNLAPKYESYQPYITTLASFVRQLCPKAKLLIHQTWAYEQGSDRLTKELGYADQKQMFDDIKDAYKDAAKAVDADGIIPSGAAFQRLIEKDVGKIHRDTFHASFGLGRFTLGLLWYSVLTGKSVENVDFSDFDEPLTDEQIAAAKLSAAEVLK